MAHGRMGFTGRAIRVAAVLAALAGIAFAASALRTGNGRLLGLELTGGKHEPPGSGVFYISGNITGLYPGVATKLPVTVTNPNNFGIRVTSLTVSVVSTDMPGCAPSSSNLQVRNYTGSGFKVKTHQSAVLNLQIRMPQTVASPCQGARFGLSYGGTATKAK
jgi:hypothetical protein